VTRPRAADDFPMIRARMEELRRDRARPRAADDFSTRSVWHREASTSPSGQRAPTRLSPRRPARSSSSRKPTKWRNDRPRRSTDQIARHQYTARLAIQ